jgi:hypothetical protein
VIAAPFGRVKVGGREATRLLARYRVGRREIEDVRFFVSGRARALIVQVMGPPRLTDALAEDIARTMEIRDP